MSEKRRGDQKKVLEFLDLLEEEQEAPIVKKETNNETTPRIMSTEPDRSTEVLDINKESTDNQEEEITRNSIFKEILLDEIEADEDQVRKDKQNLNYKLEELAATIKLLGLIDPLVVWKIGDRRWKLIAGERRYLAAKMAKLSSVLVIEREVLEDWEKIQLQLIENLNRVNLTPNDKKNGYLTLREKVGSARKAAKLLGVSERSFFRTIKENESGSSRAVNRISIGQAVKVMDKWIKIAEKIPKEKKEELINKVEELLKALKKED